MRPTLVTSRRPPWLLTLLLAAALVLVWLRPMDQAAERYTEQGFQRALTTFAAARVLNGALSLAQNVEVSAAVVAVRPGAVLRPIDELVEQFSTLMLGATISFALQKFLLQLTSAWPLCLLLSVLLVTWAVLRWRRPVAPRALAAITLGLLCLRLVVPLCALGSEATYRWLLADDYTQAQARISSIRTPDLAPPAAGDGWAERTRQWLAQVPELGRQLSALKAQADALVEHLARLAAVFLLQTLVLPLLFLWLAWRLARLLLGLNRAGLSLRTAGG